MGFFLHSFILLCTGVGPCPTSLAATVLLGLWGEKLLWGTELLPMTLGSCGYPVSGGRTMPTQRARKTRGTRKWHQFCWQLLPESLGQSFLGVAVPGWCQDFWWHLQLHSVLGQAAGTPCRKTKWEILLGMWWEEVKQMFPDFECPHARSVKKNPNKKPKKPKPPNKPNQKNNFL